MQSGAISFCQIDSCRLGGVNEVIAVLLLAARFGVPVCPGGVGLCEYVQHLSIFDYICVSASLEDRILEYVDHLHEHFVDPVKIKDGRYVPPERPGYSIEMWPESLKGLRVPQGQRLGGPGKERHLNGRVAAVLGVGSSVARRFASEGFAVALMARGEESVAGRRRRSKSLAAPRSPSPPTPPTRLPSSRPSGCARSSATLRSSSTTPEPSRWEGY